LVVTRVQTISLVLLTIPPGNEMLKEVRYVLINVSIEFTPLLETSEPMVPMIGSDVKATAGFVIPPRVIITSWTMLMLVKALEIVIVNPESEHV